MAKTKNTNLGIKVNVDFALKAKDELNTYVKKLKDVQNLSNGRLGSKFAEGMVGNINKASKSLDTLMKSLDNPRMKKGEKIKLINITGQELATLKTSLQSITKFWDTEIKKSAAANKNLEELIAKRKQLTSLKGKITKNTNKSNAAEEELNKLGYSGGTTQKDRDSVKSSIRNIGKTIAKNKEAGVLDNKELEDELALLKLIDKQLKIIIDARKTSKDLGGEVKALSSINGSQATSDPEVATKRLDKAILKEEGLTEDPAVLEQIAAGFQQIEHSVNATSSSFDNFEASGKESLDILDQETEEYKQTAESIKQIFAQFGIGISAVSIVNYFKSLASAAFEFYRSLDEALISIQVVSNLSSQAVMQLKDDFINMSKDSGMAIDDITQAAVLFYQQGLDTSAVLEMTEVTAEFAKVAGIDATDAADKLTAAVNGYCLSAEDASLVADKFNKVAAASAADIDELSTAFSKAAAQANQAGVSMDNYLAYIATMEEATREAPENIGTSLKTIFSRMEQIKTAGSSEDGETDVNAVETALKSVGVQLRDSENQLRDLEDVLDELGGKWQSLDINTQAYLGTIIAGTRQQSRFITLMQNWDRVLELSEESENSAGQQAIMHRKAMDSLNTAVQQLTNAWQTFLSNLTDSKAFKTILKLLTNLLNLVNKGNAPFVVLSAAIAMLSKNLSKLGRPLMTGWKNLRNFGKSVKGLSVKNFGKDLKNLKQEMEDANDEFDMATATHENYKKELVDVRAQIKLAENAQESEGVAVDELRMKEAALKQQVAASGQAQVQAGENAKLAAQSYQAASQSLNTLMSVGTGAVGIVTLLVSLFGKADDTSGQLAIAITMMAAGIVIAIFAIKMAIDKTTASLMANPIGAIITGITMAITGLISVISALVNSSDNAAKKMKESMQAIGDKLDSVGEASTAISQVERTLEKYHELNNMIYRTKEQQAELNETIQALADTYDLEVLTDKYGNLSINIEEVNEKLAEEKEELAELEKELRDAEEEGYKDNKFNSREYYRNLFSRERSSYKSLLTGIDSGDVADNVELDAQQIKRVDAEFKDAVMSYTEDKAYWFSKLGITVSEFSGQINDAINAAVDDNAWEEYYDALADFSEDVDNLSYEEMERKLDRFFKQFQQQCGLTTQQVELLREAMEGTLYGDTNLDETIKSLEDSIDKTKLLDQKLQEVDEETAIHWYDYLYWGGWEKMGKKIIGFQAAYEEVENMNTESTQTMINNLKKLTAASGDAMTMIGAYSDVLDENGHVLMSAADFFNKFDIEKINDAFDISDAKGGAEIIRQLSEQIKETDDADLKKALREKINDVMDDMQITAHMSWGDVADELDDLSKDLRNMNNILQEFNETGGMTLDTFMELADLMDGLDMESLFRTGMVEEYIAALDQLNLGFDASTGYITAEGGAMNDLQTIQEALAKAQIMATIAKLENSKASLQAELDMVEVEKQGTDAAIAFLEKQGEGTIALDAIQKEANTAYLEGMNNAMKGSLASYRNMLKNNAEWAEASIRNAGKVGDAINKAMTGNLTEGELRDMLNNIYQEAEWEGVNASGIDELVRDEDEKGKVDIKSALAKLKEYRTQLDNNSNAILVKIKGLDTLIAGLYEMSQKDLSKLGAEKTAEMEKYIGELQEIYNLLRKIEGVEARLDNLEDYNDFSRGDNKAAYLKEQIGLQQELFELNKDLLAQQKYMENTEQQAILGSPVGDVFSFDEFGNIIIDYEKYNALQDEAADGQQTLKELADELYEEYQDLHDTTHEYYKNLVSSLEKSIDAQQELVDTYVDLEHDLADAVIDIYQKMLDEKLAAIDIEIEALDKLRTAREEANKAKDDSKDLSDMQTSLKRAMMDTSGASNTKVLSYQDQIRNKLEEMGEDEYTKRMDEINEALEEQKEQLQEAFDEFFEDYEALYDMIETRILPNEEAVIETLMSTEDYLHASDAERAQLMDDWKTNYAVAMTALQDGGSIMDVVDSIFNLKDAVSEIDELLRNKSFAQEVGNTISQVLTSYLYNQGSGGSGGSGGGGGGGNNSSNKGGGGTGGNNNDTKPDTSNINDFNKDPGKSHTYAFNVGDSVRSNVGRWVTGYAKTSKGDLQKPTKQNQTYYFYETWFDIVDRDHYNGTSYYELQDNKGNTAWVNGHQIKYKKGGMVYNTGPAWLDGTTSAPEAVLNASQTRAFLQLADHFDELNGATGNSIMIENISFNVDSMSSPEDGEKAFNAFVNKFKEIGSQTGLSFNTNRL